MHQYLDAILISCFDLNLKLLKKITERFHVRESAFVKKNVCRLRTKDIGNIYLIYCKMKQLNHVEFIEMFYP